MSKNSTLKLWDHFLKEKYSDFNKLPHIILSKQQIGPKKETINIILGYASSVKGIKTKSNNILVSLN